MSKANPWTILVVDDDQGVIDVTQLVLEDFTFRDRSLRILVANSSKHARELIEMESDIALSIIDVVMETEHAGLDLVRHIRNNLHNHDMRIALRTGNPGTAPSLEIMRHMEIDDYKEKTELTADRLEMLVLTGLRAYSHIKASDSKSRFLSTMSHEIRTPLNAIIGLSNLMLRTELNPRQHDYLVKIENSGRQLLGVISDILDLSKIEAGKIRLEAIEFNLELLLNNVMSMVKMRAQDKGLELILDVAPGIDYILVGDPQRLSQILLNYVSNAIKFTERGQVMITVNRLHDYSSGRVLLRFDVVDTGIGMTPAEASKVFQDFQQGDSSVSRKYGGSGLGLSIAKNLTHLIGGEVGLTSEKGHGSTFWFTASLRPANHNREDPATLLAKYFGTRVLVADDNLTTRQLLSKMLTRLGMIVDEVGDGEAAIELYKNALAKDQPYRLILMDLYMPVLDGILSAKAIRSLAGTHPLSIVCVTGAMDEEIAAQVHEGDFDGVLPKPITSDQIFDSINGQLSKPLNAGKINQISDSNKSEVLVLGGRIANKKVLLVDDDRLYRKIGVDLLAAAGIQNTVAVNGEEALKKLAVETFDLVLMDIHMPLMDGVQAVRQLRQNPMLAQLPVIAMTAGTTLDQDNLWMNLGFNEILPKPIIPESLYMVLERWLLPCDPFESGKYNSSVLLDRDDVAVHQKSQVVSLLPIFCTLLQRGDADSIEWFLEHQSELTSLMGSKVVKLKNALNSFDFEKALILVEDFCKS